MGLIDTLVRNRYQNQLLEQEYQNWIQERELTRRKLAASAGIEPEGATYADIYKEIGRQQREQYEYNKAIRQEKINELERVREGRKSVEEMRQDGYDATEIADIVRDPYKFENLSQAERNALSTTIGRATPQSVRKFAQTQNIRDLQYQDTNRLTPGQAAEMNVMEFASAYRDWLVNEKKINTVPDITQRQKLLDEFSKTETGKNLRKYGVNAVSIEKALPDVFGGYQQKIRTANRDLYAKIQKNVMDKFAEGEEITQQALYSGVMEEFAAQGIQPTQADIATITSLIRKETSAKAYSKLGEIKGNAVQAYNIATNAFGTTDLMNEELMQLYDSDAGLESDGKYGYKEYSDLFENYIIPKFQDVDQGSHWYGDSGWYNALEDMDAEVKIASPTDPNKQITQNISKEIPKLFSNKYKDVTQKALRLYGSGIYSKDAVANQLVGTYSMGRTIDEAEAKWIADTLDQWRINANMAGGASRALYVNAELWGTKYVDRGKPSVNQPKKPSGGGNPTKEEGGGKPSTSKGNGKTPELSPAEKIKSDGFIIPGQKTSMNDIEEDFLNYTEEEPYAANEVSGTQILAEALTQAFSQYNT